MLDTILLTQSGTGGSGGDSKSPEEMASDLCKDMLEKMPDLYDLEDAKGRFPYSR